MWQPTPYVFTTDLGEPSRQRRRRWPTSYASRRRGRLRWPDCTPRGDERWLVISRGFWPYLLIAALLIFVAYVGWRLRR
jgi:hypothetical protein